MTAKPSPSTNSQPDWAALFRDRSLSYSQIAKKTGRKRSTVIRKASELHLRYIRSGRQGPNSHADEALGKIVTQMKREGYSNQEIAAKTGMSLTSITHAHDRYGAKKVRKAQ